jgi:hypothetical protein
LIYCQPGDDKKLQSKGFTNIQSVNNYIEWRSISINRFPADHGEGIIKLIMGKSSSYFIQNGNETLFITGDAVLNHRLVNSLKETMPVLIIANTGSAMFNFGKPITLTADSLLQMKSLLPDAKIIAVHMNAINHCRLSKEELRKFAIKENLTDIIIPNEGDILSFK